MTTLELSNTTLLEEMLKESGVFGPQDHLVIEDQMTEAHDHSTFFHFLVHNAGCTSIPSHIVLKSSHNDGVEARFYSNLPPIFFQLPVLPCLGVRHNPATMLNQILLEDVSATHSNICDWPSPLPAQAARELVESLAALHAAFWDKPRLGTSPVGLPPFLQDEASHEAYLSFTQRDLEFYVSQMAGDVTPVQSRLYRSALNALGGMWEKFWSPRLASGGLTLIHGNLNPCNVLYPNHSGGKVYFADWEMCCAGLPASDLTMLLGLNLCPDQEDAIPLLRRYHTSLCLAGVKEYPFDALLADYQIALLYELFFPIKRFAHSGILDCTIIENSLTAIESFEEALF